MLADMLMVDGTDKTHGTDTQTERHDPDILLWVQLEGRARASAHGRAERPRVHGAGSRGRTYCAWLF